MQSNITYLEESDNQFLLIKGKFGENLLNQFRETLARIKAGKRCVVDFSEVDYLDSTALGLLIILRERIGGTNQVSLAHCKPTVRHILETAKFGKLFSYN